MGPTYHGNVCPTPHAVGQNKLDQFLTQHMCFMLPFFFLFHFSGYIHHLLCVFRSKKDNIFMLINLNYSDNQDFVEPK